MMILQGMKRLWPLALLTLLMVMPTLPVYATNPPTGLTFDHVIIIAMENQNFADVIGSTSALFITSLANMGSAMSNYNSYAQSIGPSGCSAACYQAVTSGVSTVGDGWCDSNPPCPSTDGSSDTNNIANQLNASGPSSAMFCENSCPRHADHFSMAWLQQHLQFMYHHELIHCKL